MANWDKKSVTAAASKVTSDLILLEIAVGEERRLVWDCGGRRAEEAYGREKIFNEFDMLEGKLLLNFYAMKTTLPDNKESK